MGEFREEQNLQREKVNNKESVVSINELTENVQMSESKAYGRVHLMNNI